MNKIIFTIQIVAAALWLQSCEMLENPEPREKIVEETYTIYSYIPAGKKEIVLNEDFSTNSRGWPMSFTTTQSHLFVGNGVLNMMSEGGGQITSTVDLSSFTGNTNFEIETLVQIEDSWGDYGNKIMCGLNATTKQHNFIEINDYDREISIGRFDGRNDIKSTIDTYYGAGYYRQGDYNKYTIRKVDNVCYYFLNEILLYQEPFADFNGYRIGFQVANFTELNINWLTVKKLNL